MDLKSKCIDSMCRICLNENNHMTYLFQSDATQNILEAVTLCSGVKISHDDTLPKQICNECFILANNALFFRQKCLSSDTKLKDYLACESTSFNPMDLNLMNLNDIGDYFQFESLFPSPKHPLMECDVKQSSVASGVTALPCYICHMCQSVLKSCKDLVEHVLSSHAPMQMKSYDDVTCHMCGRKLENKFQHAKHKYSHPEMFAVGDAISCPFCNELFSSFEFQQKHIDAHVESSFNRCDKCDCYFSTDLQLTDHNKISHVKDENKDLTIDSDILKTDMCLMDDSYSFLEKELDLENDDFIDTNNLSNSFVTQPVDDSQCITEYDSNKVLSEMLQQCGKTFSENEESNAKLEDPREETLNEEFVKPVKKIKMKPSGRSTPKKTKKYNTLLCNLCPKTFTRDQPLRRHLAWHSGEKSAQCPECGKMFTQKYILDRHIKSKHKDTDLPKEEFACSICSKKFTQSNHLKAHIRGHNVDNSNENSKTLICPVCGKSLSTTSNLKVHMRRHTGDHTITCAICNKGFYRKIDLALHMRHHTGETVFKCDQCDMSFKRSDVLALHKRVHTNERPFSCELCERRFKYKCDLLVHTKNKSCKKRTKSRPENNMNDINIKVLKKLKQSSELKIKFLQKDLSVDTNLLPEKNPSSSLDVIIDNLAQLPELQNVSPVLQNVKQEPI